MSVSLRVTGTWAELTADGSVAIPATPQAGDRMYLFARWKDFSITATVANWTELIEFADGSVSAGNGTGSVKVACWYRDWQSGDSDPTIDFSASPDNASVVITVMQKGADDVWLTPVAVTAATTNWTTTSQSVSASATVDVPSSSVVMGLIGIRDDSAVMTRPTNGIDDSGGLITWNGNYVESPATHHSTTTGFDGAADLGHRLVTTGATGATLRLTGTISAAETGAALWVVQGVSVLVTPAAASLITSTFAPLLKLVITPAVAVLTIASFAPQLRLVVTPAATTLTLTTSAPSIGLGVVPITAILSTTTFAPALNLQITPPAATLTLTPFAVQLQESLTPANATLNVTGFAPTANFGVIPAIASLTLGTFAPAVVQNILITIPSASLTLTTSHPHVLPFSPVFLDPGGDATHATGHFNAISGAGSTSFDSTQQVAGAGSYRFDSGAGGDPCVAQVTGVLSHNPSAFVSRRVSVYFRYDSVPDSATVTSSFCEDNAVYSGGGFNDPAFTNADDGTYATATPARNAGQGSKMIPITSFNAQIPVGAAIDLVKIVYERKYDVNTSIGVSRVKYLIDGIEGPDYDNTDMPLTDTVVTVDLTADRGFTREDLMDGVFEVVAEARRGDTDIEHTQSWDYVKVEVVWHLDGIIAARDSVVSTDSFQLGLSRKGAAAVLRFVDGLGASYLGITPLVPNTDYRISLAYILRNASSLSNLDINIFVDGIPELSITDAATESGPLFNLRYGWLDSPGVNHLCWFSHLAIDAGDDLQDPRRPLMTAKLLASVNEDTWSTTGGTGAVNERPLSETNHMRDNTTNGARQTYTLQTAAAGDVDISGAFLLGYMGWAWAKASNNSQLEEIKLVTNGVDTDVTSPIFLAPNNTPLLLHAAFADSAYPDDAAGIGMVGNIDDADIFLYECGVVVAYEGPPNPNILLERQEVANETLGTITDDLRADPPDSYEVCCQFPEFDGTVEIIAHSLDQDGGSVQFQGTLNSNGRMRITPGVEVYLDVTVTGVTNLQIWRRLNVD